MYRKLTHTDLYLQWDSYHSLAAKYTVINTLTHRDKTVYSSPQLLKEEEDHLRQALIKCRYPVWALNQNQQFQQRFQQHQEQHYHQTNKPHIVVPYIKGLSKSCKNICSKHEIQMHFKGGKDLLVKPRDKDTIWQKSGVIYRYKCGKRDCEDEWGVRQNICRKIQRIHESPITQP